MSDMELAYQLARVLREERMRQFRENEPDTWPLGRYDYEETQAPWLEAKAAIAFLRERGFCSQASRKGGWA